MVMYLLLTCRYVNVLSLLAFCLSILLQVDSKQKLSGYRNEMKANIKVAERGGTLQVEFKFA